MDTNQETQVVNFPLWLPLPLSVCGCVETLRSPNQTSTCVFLAILSKASASGEFVDLEVYRDDVAAVASVLKFFLVSSKCGYPIIDI